MPDGLKRFQQSAQSHFVTFTCYHRRRGFDSPAVYALFVQVLEQMRRHYALREKAVVEIESEWTARDRERQAQGGTERIFLVPG